MDIERIGLADGHLHPDLDNTTCGCDNQYPIGQMVSKTGLAQYSPKDKHWNNHRANTDAISEIYARAEEFERYADRMGECSGWLGFKFVAEPATGEAKLKLRKANFCRVRYCPVCQWRRSLMWQAKFMQALPRITEEFPKARWLFLTLTVRNCEISDLSDELQLMNKAWNKFIKRKDLKPVKGWIRTTEVTKGEDRSAHPHFHVLMMVPPSWFTHNYVKQSRFVELWRESLQANYDPSVDVRVVKPKKGKDKTLAPATSAELLQGAVSETLKYSTKAGDMMGDAQWFLELTRQTKKKRFLATGGALKDILKVDQETNEDLIHAEDGEDIGPDNESELIRFHWDKPRKEYHKNSQ